jgi:RNA polymerase sigma-70 factor (ECF subfamily)
MREELIQACIKGNRSAQTKLYQSYAKAMYNIACRMMGDEEEAQDILQMSFVDVFRNLHQYNFVSTPGSWIKRIVVNRCITQLRKKKLEVDSWQENLHDIPEEEEIEVDQLTVDSVKKCIAELPEGYRVVLSLYLLEGYDHQEIGEILGITASTSKSQYSRARKKLKEIVKQYLSK